MEQILIVSGHTDLSQSVINKQILENLSSKLPKAEIIKLDQLYPDFKIDTKKEQERLLNKNIIICQFPMFWFSAPSILERYIEQTFTHGFSHGSTGDKLKGKKLIISCTIGAPEELYQKDGLFGFKSEDYFHMFKSLCALTQMKFAGYICSYGNSYLMRTSKEMIEAQKLKSGKHTDDLINLVNSLLN